MPAAPTVRVGGFPTGIAFDGATRTVYVPTGETNVLTVVNAATCNASTTAGCAHVRHAVTAGQDPIGVVVDDQTRTVYVVNGGSNTVAVINAATCNALITSGCSKRPALVRVPGGPEFLALNPRTDTVYVADTSSGQVSVINGATCNATDTSGCAKTPATVSVGAGAFPIAADPGTNTVYVGTNRDLVVIDGRTCNGTDVSGCAKVLARIRVGGDPAGIAVDQAAGSIYVSSQVTGAVTVINRNTCSALDTAGCAARLRTITVGSDPRGDSVDQATQTVYVTNAESNTVSMINAATCNAVSISGCKHSPTAFPVGASPRRIAVDAAAHTVDISRRSLASMEVVRMPAGGAARLTAAAAG
jgi:DNA-binding beta-propeller fold protein YncE